MRTGGGHGAGRSLLRLFVLIHQGFRSNRQGPAGAARSGTDQNCSSSIRFRMIV